MPDFASRTARTDSSSSDGDEMVKKLHMSHVQWRRQSSMCHHLRLKSPVRSLSRAVDIAERSDSRQFLLYRREIGREFRRNAVVAQRCSPEF